MSNVIGTGAPIYYQYINASNSIVSPSTVHIHNTGLSNFFKRYLLQKAMSVFKWKLPDAWEENYFLYVLYCWGYIAVVNTDKYGVIPQACGLQGYNIFYQPTTAVITNPLLKGILTPKIDIQCSLFRLQPDYGGIMDIVDFYADMMALCAETAGVNLVNSKLSYVFSADSKAGAETLKSVYDDIASGQPAVVFDKALLKPDGSVPWGAFQQNVGQNYIVGDVLADMRKIENMFNTAIGIPNANTDKKERLLTDEVNANNEETSSLCELWLGQLKKACKKTKELFGINISVNWRVKPKTTKTEEKTKEKEDGGEE
jgi:hypothetical protein